MNRSSLRAHRGFSVTEVLIGAAIVAVVVTGIASAWQFYVKLSGQSARTAQAALLTEEGAEALHYMRDKSWTTSLGLLDGGISYHLYWTGSDYAATTSPQLISGAYYRTVTLASVIRDATTQNISGTGTSDAGTYVVTISIYPGSMTAPATMSSQFLIHNMFSN